jgi:phage/plasmid-associated DNA primase
MAYNPKATVAEHNPHFGGFIHSIVDAEELDTETVKSYLQTALGYCLTGKNTEQCCFVLWGSGSNGKSLLNDTLISVMRCTAGKYCDTFNSNLFDDNASKRESANSASPEKAKLVYCHMALMNETPQGLLLGENFKKLCDNTQSMTYRRLHHESQNLKLVAKFVMSTNDFPTFNVEDCYVRRLKTIPMCMRFTDTPTEPNDRPKDTKLFDKMCGTELARQAIMNWLIEGAQKYYKNDCSLPELPPCCQAFLDRHVKLNDWARLFIKSENPKDNMNLMEVKAVIAGVVDRRDLTDAKITSTLAERGFEKKRVKDPISGKRRMAFVGIRAVNIEDEEQQEEEDNTFL